MPAELDNLHKKISSELKGKVNPKTNKPYSEDEIMAIVKEKHNKMSEKEIHFFPSADLEFKEDSGEFYSSGYIATTHPDRAENGKYKGDVLTKHAIYKIADQVNARQDLMADLMSNHHDWIRDKDPSIPPVGRAIKAEVREMGSGHYGVFVDTHHSKTHPEFEKTTYDVKNGYLPGYSIEYVPKKTTDVSLSKGTYRLIDDLDLKGYGLASGRLIANPHATIENFTYKEIQDLAHIQNNHEVTKMEQTEQKEVPSTISVDMKEYQGYKEFVEFKLKEKQKEEMKELVKQAISSILPEMKIKMDNSISKVNSSIEFKEWAEIKNDDISVKEAFLRATNLAIKTGKLDKWETSMFHAPVQFKTTGLWNEKIEIKAPLETDTNKSTDTDYLQSAAEMSDIYAPAIAKLLNQKTTYFGLLPKEDYSGRESITWRAENVANSSAAAYAEGAPISKSYTTREKLREVFKYYKVGVQLTGQAIESAKSGIGDLFAAELEAAGRRLLTLMNTDLFGTSGLYTDVAFLGLEYIATSTTYTTLYGLTRSTTNLLGASNSEFSAQASAPISKPTLRTGLRTLEINGADRSDLVIVCHPLQRDLIMSLFDDPQRFMNTSLRGGWEGQVSFDGIPILTDKDMNNDDIFVCNFGMNGLRLGIQVPVKFEDLAKTDDSRSGFLKFYGNQYAIAPKQAVYMIQGLATS